MLSKSWVMTHCTHPQQVCSERLMILSQSLSKSKSSPSRDIHRARLFRLWRLQTIILMLTSHWPFKGKTLIEKCPNKILRYYFHHVNKLPWLDFVEDRPVYYFCFNPASILHQVLWYFQPLVWHFLSQYSAFLQTEHCNFAISFPQYAQNFSPPSMIFESLSSTLFDSPIASLSGCVSLGRNTTRSECLKGLPSTAPWDRSSVWYSSIRSIEKISPPRPRKKSIGDTRSKTTCEPGSTAPSPPNNIYTQGNAPFPPVVCWANIKFVWPSEYDFGFSRGFMLQM